MKKNILLFCILFVSLPMLFSCGSKSEQAIKIAKEACIEEYPSVKIKDAVSNALLSPECFAKEGLDNWFVTFKGTLNNKLMNGFFEEFGNSEISYTFKVNLSNKEVEIDSFIVEGKLINSNYADFDGMKIVLLAILFNDEETFTTLAMDAFSNDIPVVKTSSEYVSGQREIFDWYTSLGLIETESSDDIPASVIVDIALACTRGDSETNNKITANADDIKNVIGEYLKTKTSDELRNPNNEDTLENEIKQIINEKFVGDSKIRDVVFQQKDVTLND